MIYHNVVYRVCWKDCSIEHSIGTVLGFSISDFYIYIFRNSFYFCFLIPCMKYPSSKVDLIYPRSPLEAYCEFKHECSYHLCSQTVPHSKPLLFVCGYFPQSVFIWCLCYISQCVKMFNQFLWYSLVKAMSSDDSWFL